MKDNAAIRMLRVTDTLQKYDVIVAGGGMVGALAAVLLSKELAQQMSLQKPQQELRVAVVEGFDIRKLEFGSNPMLRTSAFSHSSIELLKSIGAWQQINPARHAPYTGLQTWQQRSYSLEFSATDINAEYLGHILENSLVQQAIWQVFADFNIEVICPAKVVSYQRDDEVSNDDPSHVDSSNVDSSNTVTVNLDNGQVLQTHLLVGADGGQSKIRQLAGIGTDGWQYAQQCFAINVQMKDDQDAITWQEFHPTGPRAYLPLFDNFASLIWYDSADTIKQLLNLKDDKLKQRIIDAFPQQLADFTIIDKAAFPLTRMHAKSYYQDNLALIGDAAHTINPLAGQGVNLGFKDAQKLAECLVDGLSHGRNFYDTENLKAYQRSRYPHNLLMMSAMDACYVGFSNEIKPLSILRNLALKAANNAGPLKLSVMKYAMGL